MYWVHKFQKSRSAGIFFVIVILIVCACSTNNTGISREDQEAFINTYVELTLTQIKHGNRIKTYESLLENIYARNGTSKEFIDNFTTRLQGNPELQAEIYREIADRLKDLMDMPQDSLNQYIKTFDNDI
jgi:Tfp pilus assembly protein PilF